MDRSLIRIWGCALGVLLAVGAPLQADLTGDTLLCMTVGDLLSVIPPAAPAALTHDGTSLDAAFAPLTWTCLSNSLSGSTVTYETDQAMTNQVLPSIKRDIKLDLALDSADSGSGWAVTVASDQTDWEASTPDEIATVSAESSAPGNCQLSLTVTFLTGNLGTLAPGLYCSTVTATIAAK